MSQFSNNLPGSIQSVGLLAHMLSTSEFELLRFIYRKEDFYRRFRRKKSSGEYRIIAAPTGSLKEVQKSIARQFLRLAPLADECTGFRPGMSILTNALPHCGKRFVFNTDIEDFFGSISSERVLGMFMHMGFHFPIACVLTELTTYIGCLPQGAPSSPYLANLASCAMDFDLAEYCVENGWNYTRYCDDITISGDSVFTLHDMRTISDIVEIEGFQLNLKKTRFHRGNSAQMVSGLVVNKRPNLPRSKRRQIRAMFHQAQNNPDKFKDRVKELENQLSMLSMLNPQADDVLRYREILDGLRSRLADAGEPDTAGVASSNPAAE